MDKLKAMQTFIRIADTGSLTAAAYSQSSSLPAVVRTLALLEAELGVRLINRTTRQLALTIEGSRYLARCRQVIADVVEAEAELRAEHQAPRGRLRITAPVLFGQLHVCPVVTQFVQRYPDVKVEVQLLDRVTDLLDEEFDLGIRIGALADSSLIAQKVGHLRRMVVATPAYLAQFGRPLHPKDLLTHNCLCFLGASAPWWTFSERGKILNLPVQGNLSYNLVEPLRQACCAGLGLGMFISSQIAAELADGRLCAVLEEYEPAPRAVSIVYPQARQLPTRTRVFIDWIKPLLSQSLV
jgi:DNA-binding transcriptional LysR family regulator